MLAKKHRLTREEFSKYFKTGKRINSPIATLIISHHPSFHGAVVVSKKVHKKAVKRNTIRRRAYSQLYNQFKNKKSGVYILIIKPNIMSLTKKQQHQKIAELIEQVS